MPVSASGVMFGARTMPPCGKSELHAAGKLHPGPDGAARRRASRDTRRSRRCARDSRRRRPCPSDRAAAVRCAGCGSVRTRICIGKWNDRSGHVIRLRLQRPDVRDERVDVRRVELAVVAIRHDREERLAVLVDPGRDRAGDLAVGPVGERRRRDVARVELAGHAHRACVNASPPLPSVPWTTGAAYLVQSRVEWQSTQRATLLKRYAPRATFCGDRVSRQRRRLGHVRIGRDNRSNPARSRRERPRPTSRALFVSGIASTTSVNVCDCLRMCR